MKIAIIGTGGHSRVVSEIIKKKYKFIIHYFDDKIFQSQISIQGNTDLLLKNIKDYKYIFIAIGDNSNRKYFFTKFIKYENKMIPLVDESASLQNGVKLNYGTIVFPKVCINANTIIGKGCIINTNSVIEHDCQIGDFTHISPSSTVLGSVKIGSCSLVGANATILNNIEVEKNVIIGASTIVLKNILKNKKVVGNPPREI